MNSYVVICGNIGMVYSGGVYQSALDAFTVYKNKSIRGEGRASGESVTMFRNGEVIKEFIGSTDENED